MLLDACLGSRSYISLTIVSVAARQVYANVADADAFFSSRALEWCLAVSMPSMGPGSERHLGYPPRQVVYCKPHSELNERATFIASVQLPVRAPSPEEMLRRNAWHRLIEITLGHHGFRGPSVVFVSPVVPGHWVCVQKRLTVCGLSAAVALPSVVAATSARTLTRSSSKARGLGGDALAARLAPRCCYR